MLRSGFKVMLCCVLCAVCVLLCAVLIAHCSLPLSRSNPGVYCMHGEWAEISCVHYCLAVHYSVHQLYMATVVVVARGNGSSSAILPLLLISTTIDCSVDRCVH